MKIIEQKIFKTTPLILIPYPNINLFTFLVIFKTGSINETPEINGISHFLEHLFFKGSKKYPSTLKLSKALDRIGAEYNAFTSKEYTGFYIKALKENFAKALEIFGDMLSNPIFRSEDIDKERSVIIEEINMYKDTPAKYVSDIFENLILNKTSLKYPILGNIESLKKINKDKILKYYTKYYRFNNALIIIAGNYEKNFKRIINKNFMIPLSFNKKRIKIKFKLPKKKIQILNKNTDQVHIMLGFPSISPKSKQVYPLRYLSTILGESMSSRLFINIRDKMGFCYYINSFTQFYKDIGYLGIKAGLKKDNLKEAILEIKNILENIKRKITIDEILVAKDLIKSKLFFNLETAEEIAFWAANQKLLLDKILKPNEIIKKFEKVKKDDIINIARKIIDFSKLYICAIGEVSNKDLKI